MDWNQAGCFGQNSFSRAKHHKFTEDQNCHVTTAWNLSYFYRKMSCVFILFIPLSPPLSLQAMYPLSVCGWLQHHTDLWLGEQGHYAQLQGNVNVLVQKHTMHGLDWAEWVTFPSHSQHSKLNQARSDPFSRRNTHSYHITHHANQMVLVSTQCRA